MNDTIVAISTAMGIGAISIVRLSGPEAIAIANSCFKGKDLEQVQSHTIHYGYIYDKEITNLIDEVLVSVMKAPKTYTSEDIVEINCHGGIITTNKILETMIQHGARLAEPGEFTKRAFLNGKIDLIKSEAIMDLIESKSEESRKIALNQISGSTSTLITEFRDRLKNLLSSIEVNIDYPEYYDIEVVTENKIQSEITTMKEQLLKLIENSESISTLKRGINTVIIGKPNVGKSSILNKLLLKDKAIVTDIAGTTRDIVEGEVSIDGVLLNIIDTAGIRDTEDVVEKIGVEKSISMIEEADLVIVVLNSNELLSDEDKIILEKTKEKQRIIVLNKNDLEKNIILPENIDLNTIIETNTMENNGIDKLKNKIKELFQLEKIKTKDYTSLSNVRQITLAKKAYESLVDAEKSVANNQPVDIVEIDLKECFDFLGEIIGENYSEEIIDNLFKNFCVGK